MTNIGTIRLFLNSLQLFVEGYEFDNSFDQQIQNKIKIIKGRLNASSDNNKH